MTGTVITIAGSAMSLKEGTLNIRHRVDDKDTATFTIIDSSGTLAFSKGQTVSITDSSLPNPNLFSGYINKPTATNLYPNATNEWSMDCVSQFYVAAKKSTSTSKAKPKRGGKHVKQQSGAIVANQIQQYLAPDGVTGNFALDWSELQTDWQTGTQSGVTAATNTSTGNVGAGDLELAPTGTPVTFQQQTQADFNAGTTNGGLSSPATGGVTFTPTPAIKFQATEALPGVTNPYIYTKIWDNSISSYTIPSTFPTLFYDMWIADSCPQQMAGIEIVCTDGTSFLAQPSQWNNGTQNVSSALTTDLSGLATNQWFSRALPLYGLSSLGGKTIRSIAVAFGGSNQGTYTAYFRNVKIAQNDGVTNLLSVFSSSATAMPVTPQQLQTNGYNAMSCTFVTSYERHGFMYSPFYSIASVGLVQSSFLNWNVTLPTSDFTFTITASVDTFATFLPCTNNGAIPGLLPGMNAGPQQLILVYVFNNAGNDPTLTPFLSKVYGGVNSTYACTKSDIVNMTDLNTGWSGGTLTNLINNGSNQLQLNGFARNWDDANYGSQTLYGNTSPAQGVSKKQFFITSGTGTDAKSRLDFAGSTWQNFTAEVDISLPAANVQNSLVYRTVGWQGNNDTYGYVATISTTQVQLGKGTNSSSGAGSFTSLATFALTLATNQTYRMKIIINGNSHMIYVNDVLCINTTDATYTAAGYIGLRIYNNSGSTQTTTFDNFGVVASLSGTWVSPAIDIHSLGTISNSQLNLQIDPNINTTLCTFLAEISLNNGSTWSTCPNIQPTLGYYYAYQLPGLTPGTNVSSLTQVKVRLTINTSTAATGTLMPDLTAVTLWVVGAYSSVGTRSTAPLAWDSMTRGNVVGGFGTATNGATYTKSGTGTVALTSNEALISNTTGDVQMQIGTLTQQDTDETIRFELSASTISAGMELHFSDSSHYYRLVASTTALNVMRNAGGGNSTIATSAVTLTTGTFYRMRFRAVTSGLTSLTFYGRVWADGSPEPSAWGVTIADSPYKATVLADSPIRYYRLDDTNTTAIDIGSGAHNGTLNGGITKSQPGLLVGDTDTAMSFDGSTGYVSLPTTGLPTGTASWTLEAWCQISSIPGSFNVFLAMGNRASLQMAALYIVVNSGVASFLLGLFGSTIQSSAAISLNTPYHVCATYDATNVRLYVNGALVAGPTPFTMNLVQSFASISSDGVSPSQFDFFPGVIDEAAIYSTALSAQQILNHYNAGIASGGFALMANGTGTASFDTYRVTAYPDPSVSLLSASRAVNSLVNWNGVFPTNTNVAVSTSLDNGTTWQPHANPSDYIPTISTAAYYASVRSNSPLAFYRLNEKTGLSVYDSSNNGNTGTITGGVTLGQVGGLQGVNEMSDTAMLFDGSTGYVALPSAVTTNSLTALTVECWLNPSALPTSMNPRVLANSHTDVDFHGVQLAVAGGGSVFPTGATGTVGFDIGNGSTATQIESTSQLVIGTWTYVVVTWDGSNLKLYWNGSLQSTVAFTGPISSTTSVMNIGRNPVYAGDYFPGTVQGVALYPTALSANAITAHYNAATQATQSVYSDSFTVNTSAQYTQTFGTGGSGATSWTWDTTNSRVVAVGGSRALLVFNTFTASDIDIFTDWLQSESGGFIWRYTNASNYYELVLKDRLASSSPNTVTLNKMSGGTLTQLATTSITWQVTTGGVITDLIHHRFHITMFGGVVTVFMDENQILTYTDGSPLASGQWGLRNDTGTSYCYLLQATPQAANISNLFLCVKQQLSTSDPTVTPQITDHQALVSDSTIGTGVTISSVDYRTTYVSDNIDDQNTQSNYWWNIGPAGVTFQPRNAANAPYILQSSDILIGTLPTVEYSGDLYRNQQVLKGVVQNSVFSQNFIGDGQSKTWNVANPISGVPTITLNGQAQTVGIQGVDSGKQFYYQLGSTSITQDNSGTVLRSGLDTLGVAYLGAIGIDFAIDNTGQFSGTISQAQMAAMDKTTGIVSAIEDVSSKNMDVNAATTYANQLLQRYGSIARTLVCDTLHNGLQIGQSLPVFIPQLNIFDSVFLIVEIGITVRTVAGGPQYVYHLTCSEAAALSSWVKTFSKILRSVTGTKSKV